MYEEAPQLYAQMLQNGLDKQFQLATQAQPVSQFLAGLRQAQIQKMQQEQADWQRQKFDEQQSYNVGRDQLVDKRYRDLAEERSQDRQTAEKDKAENNRERRNQNIFTTLNMLPGTAGPSGEMRTNYIKSLGGDPLNYGTMESNADVTGENFVGPTDAENPPTPTRVSMTYEPGSGWMALMQKAEDARQAREDAANQRDQFHQDSLAHQKTMEGISAATLALSGKRFNASQTELTPDEYKAQEKAKLFREYTVKGNAPIGPNGMQLDPEVAAETAAEKMKQMVYPNTVARPPLPKPMQPKRNNPLQYPQVTDSDSYNAVPIGQKYIDPNGVTRTKGM